MPELAWPEIAAAVSGLDVSTLQRQRWFGGKGRQVDRISLAHAFVLPSVPSRAGVTILVLAVVDVHAGTRHPDRYSIPLVVDADGIREARVGDGAWHALGRAIAEARTLPGVPRHVRSAAPPMVEAALVCRPAPGLAAVVPGGAPEVARFDERPLGADQSNTSSILGQRLLLKGYRRLVPGLNPDLEMQAYLSEEVAFPGVPRLAGWAELVTRDEEVTTVALLQEYVADAEDAYEAIAERLTSWILAPGEVALDWATQAAADMGALTAELHAALVAPPSEAVDFVPRDASRDELRAWRHDAHQQLEAAVSSVSAVDAQAAAELRDLAPAIAARFTRFEAMPSPPLVMRIHADLHLGQVLVAPDGYRIIDFEGEPARPMDERRRPGSPLRDVASMLRSLDHVGRSARRRAAARSEAADGPPAAAGGGLDIDAWLLLARDRFLESYRTSLRETGTPLSVDDDLLEAFEFAKESYEFVYAATYLPDWLWAPREGMRGLIDRFGHDG